MNQPIKKIPTKVAVDLQMIGLVIMFLIWWKLRKKFIWLTVSFLFLFFALILTEKAIGSLSLISCKGIDPFTQTNSGTMEQFEDPCLNVMTSSSDFKVKPEEPFSRGDPLHIKGYRKIIVSLIVQTILLLVVTGLQAFHHPEVTSLIKEITEKTQNDIGSDINHSFSKSSAWIGVKMTSYELMSLLLTLGLIILNGNIFQKDWTLNMDTWTFGMRIKKGHKFSGDSELLFPTFFPCPFTVGQGGYLIAPKAPHFYFYCQLQMMQVYKEFFMIYWFLLVLQAASMFIDCAFRILVSSSLRIRRFFLHRFLQKNNLLNVKYQGLENFLSTTHGRFALISKIVTQLDHEKVEELMEILYQNNPEEEKKDGYEEDGEGDFEMLEDEEEGDFEEEGKEKEKMNKTEKV